jgi:hypothetical protein
MRDCGTRVFDTMRGVRQQNVLPCVVSAIVMIAALLVFLCPVPTGPFSATHGPVTALRASRSAWLLLVLMAIAACNAIAALFWFSPLPLLLCSIRTRQDDIKTSRRVLDPLPLICELRC